MKYGIINRSQDIKLKSIKIFIEFKKRTINRMRITVFGDSITKGLFLENGRIKRIERNCIDNISNQLGLKIENNSAFGQTFYRFNEKKILNDYLTNFDKEEKNIVILCLGGNDSDYRWGEVEKDPMGEHGAFTNPDLYYELLSLTIKKLQEQGVIVMLTSLFPIDSKRYFENTICQTHNREAILQFLHNDVNNLYRHHEQFNNLIARCAKEFACDFIDFRTPLLQKIDALDYLSWDGIHPNQAGHDFIADTICSYCKKHFNLGQESEGKNNV